MSRLLDMLGLMHKPPMARKLEAAPVVNAAAPAQAAAPKPGQMMPPRRIDHHGFLAGDLTPEKVSQILHATAFGNPREQSAAFDRMVERDEEIQQAYGKRILNVTKYDWDVRSASQVMEGDLDEKGVALADEIAAYVRRVLGSIDVVGYGVVRPQRIETGLAHLLDGIGRGLAGVEVEWATRPVRLADKSGTVVDARVPIKWHLLAPGRFRLDEHEPWRLRIQRDDSDYQGLAVDELPEGKFILHAPRSIGGNVFRGARHIPALLLYFSKVYGWRWFKMAAEIFGQPTRIAKVPAGSSPENQAAVMAMLQEVGFGGGGVFEEGTTVEITATGITSAGTKTMHERLIEKCNKGIRINYLGSSLTTDVDDSGGNRAIGEVMAEGVDDIAADDMGAIRATITPQAIRAIVGASPYAARGGLDLLPEFTYVVPERKDDAGDLSKLDTIVNRFKNYKVPKRFILERFGIPTVEEGDALNEPLEGTGGGGGLGEFGFSQRPVADRGELRVLANRALDKVLRRRSPMASVAPWLMTAILASQAHTENLVARFGAALKKLGATAFVVSADAETLPPEVSRVLIEAALDAPVDDLAELVRQFTLATRLHGERFTQLSVASAKANSRGAEGNVETSKRRNGETSEGDAFEAVSNADRITFEKLPFVEAIEALRDRIGLTPDTFLQLDGEARSRAFRVAAVWNMDLLAVLHTELLVSMKNGASPRDFRLRVLPEMADRRGWTGEHPWHADVVFYQNFVMAHSAGRFRQYDELGITHWRFVNSGESCEICTPHVGKVFRVGDVDRAPPLHFYCDCREEVVFAHELQSGEETASGMLHVPALVEERARRGGFNWNPRQYAALEPLRLEKYPADLRAAFAALAARIG